MMRISPPFAVSLTSALTLGLHVLEPGAHSVDSAVRNNPPCAFNPSTTCPMPVKDSILPVEMLAGEKAYPIHVTIPEPTT